MTVDRTKYRLIWDFGKGKPSWDLPKSMSGLRKYYKEKGYTVKTEGNIFFIKKG
jgi:hypothetical protein